jgi:hypothetical protein
MVWNVKLPNVHNEITRIGNRCISYIVNPFVIKKVESSIGTNRMISTTPGALLSRTYLATSAYVSIAFILFLFFSAIGMIILLTASKSFTFTKINCSNVLRYPNK